MAKSLRLRPGSSARTKIAVAVSSTSTAGPLNGAGGILVRLLSSGPMRSTTSRLAATTLINVGIGQPTVVGDLAAGVGSDGRARVYDLIDGTEVWASASLGSNNPGSWVTLANGRIWAYDTAGGLTGFGS